MSLQSKAHDEVLQQSLVAVNYKLNSLVSTMTYYVIGHLCV